MSTRLALASLLFAALARAQAPQPVLVWTDGTGGTHTYLLRADGEGVQVAASHDGLALIHDRRLWSWAEAPQDVALRGCGRRTVQLPIGTLESDGEQIEIIKPATPTGLHLVELDGGVWAEGSVGPVIFAFAQSDYSSCDGLDIPPLARFRVVDLSDGTRLDVDGQARERDQRAQSRALTEWVSRGADAATMRHLVRLAAVRLRARFRLFEEGLEPETVHAMLTQIRPRYVPGTGWKLDLVFSSRECLTDGGGDGEWAACTYSAVVQSDLMPPTLAPYAGPNALVDRFARTLAQGQHIGGFSAIEEPEGEEFLTTSGGI